MAIAIAAAGPASAQADDELAWLEAEVSRLHGEGKYGEAMPVAERYVALARKRQGDESLEHASAMAWQAFVYQAQGRYGEAEPLLKRSLAIREKMLGPEHADVATSLDNLAALYLSQGHYGEAEPLLKHSLAIREKALGAEHADVATPLHNLAALYLSQGRYGEAEPLLKRSLAIREKALGPEHADVATSLNDLAMLYWKQSRYGEAEHLYRRSLSILEKALGPVHADVATSLDNLAALYDSQGRYGEAEPLYKRSLAMWEKALGPEHADVATLLNNLAVLYRTQGRYGESEPLYRRSLEIREKALGPEHVDVAASLNNLAWFALARNDIAAAADYWRRATRVLIRRTERGLGGASGGSSKGEAQRLSSFFRGLIKTTHRLGGAGRDEASRRSADMFETAQWAQSSEAAASLAQMAARSTRGSLELATLVRERQDRAREWQLKDKLLIAAKSKPPGGRDATYEKVLSDRLMAIDARLAKDFHDYAALASPKPISVADTQYNLRDDEALLLFLDTNDRLKPLPEETFIWVVTKSDMRWVRSELGTEALRREIAALRCGLDASAWRGEGLQRCAHKLNIKLEMAPHDGALLPFDTVRAHALYKGLFGEAEDLIRNKHLLIVPSGPLNVLPFQVLVTEPPIAGADFAEVRWLGRRNALTVLPAVSSLKALRHVSTPSQATKPMIGFGNPLLDGLQADPEDGAYYKELAALARRQVGCASAVRVRTAELRGPRRGVEAVPQGGGLAHLAYLRVQPPLPETADELCAVARDLKADVGDIRIGARANEAEVKRLSARGDLARYRVVHFATHGTLAGELRGTNEPGLILTPPETATADDDGYLSSSEIASLKLDADLVILSACNTVAGEDVGGETLSGLARAFFYAGARALLVSHWYVDSDATVALIPKAFEVLKADPKLGRAEAMRRAMSRLIADGGRMAHPANWAPFVVVGEGGAAR